MKGKLRSWAKNIASKLLLPFGYSIVKNINSNEIVGTMPFIMRALHSQKHVFNTVIDIGASNGSWSLELMKYFPNCHYHLIEAQKYHDKSLVDLKQVHNNISYTLAAAGDKVGSVYFDLSDPFGGQAASIPDHNHSNQVPVTTIDHEVQGHGLAAPFLLKFDTHGFEVPILKGALTTISTTNVIIMECYNFRISPECLLFYEMCEYLKQYGFRCINFADPMYRPIDNSFWQMDLVFIRDSSPEFLISTYS